MRIIIMTDILGENVGETTQKILTKAHCVNTVTFDTR